VTAAVPDLTPRALSDIEECIAFFSATLGEAARAETRHLAGVQRVCDASDAPWSKCCARRLAGVSSPLRSAICDCFTLILGRARNIPRGLLEMTTVVPRDKRLFPLLHRTKASLRQKPAGRMG